MVVGLIIILFFIVSLWVFLHRPIFGAVPSGNRLKKIKQSPHFKNGAFENVSHTPQLTEGASYINILWDFFIARNKYTMPIQSIPYIKTNLHELPSNADVFIWFGHSSYFMQIDGLKILVDPVFCGHASPFTNAIKAFDGSNEYGVDDIPAIDLLFISHDHWDHLDYVTIRDLQPKIKQVVTGLGTGAHMERWHYSPSCITELDWYESMTVLSDFKITSLPARHFSGRSLKRNQTLWTSFALETPTMKIFIGGDSGYDTHFKAAGKQFGGFDLAILENGQYDWKWKYIHVLPEHFTTAAQDLQAEKVISVHNSKFALANHAWNEPMILVDKNCKDHNINLLTPIIGQCVYFKENAQKFDKWWENMQ